MIASMTPYRLSFVGGLTDMHPYIDTNEGSVINSTIDKYVRIQIERLPDGAIDIRSFNNRSHQFKLNYNMFIHNRNLFYFN